MAMDPDAAGTRLFINDVGGDAWEEVDEAEAGADYGWNVCEGAHDNPFRSGSADCTAAPYTPPVFEYAHADTGCSSVTGAAFVPDGAWPARYADSYLLGDYVCNKIFELEPQAGGGYTMNEFAFGLGPGGPIAMAFGPTSSGKEALYYTTYDGSGELHRIVHDGSEPGPNEAPIADIAANPNYSLPPSRTIDLDGSASSDLDGDTPLVYLWDFGDGTTAETTNPMVSHAYPTGNKKYTASLRVRDARGMLSFTADTVAVFPGNTPPEPVISFPNPDTLFKVGQYLKFQGSGTDAEDGVLGDSKLKWEILQHHNGNHTHPYKTGTGNDTSVKMPPPENILSTDPANNYLEIRLTATDSKGLSKTVIRNLRPRTAEVTFASQPAGVELMVNGLQFGTPRTFVSWEGYKLDVSAEYSVVMGPTTYAFDSWSNGKLPQQIITTGASPVTYTVVYRACTIVGTSGNDVIEGTPGDDTICGMDGEDTIFGRDGKDYLEGLNGNDELWGGPNGDKLRGGPGSDKMYGEYGSDTLNSKDGVSGNDTLDGGPNTDYKSTDSTEASIINIP